MLSSVFSCVVHRHIENAIFIEIIIIKHHGPAQIISISINVNWRTAHLMGDFKQKNVTDLVFCVCVWCVLDLKIEYPRQLVFLTKYGDFL